MMIIMMKKLSF